MLLLFLIIILFLLSYYWSYQCLEEMVDIKTSMHLVETMADNDNPNPIKKTIDIAKSGQVTINGILTTTCDLNVGNNLKVIGDIKGSNKLTLGNEENGGLLDVNGNMRISKNICLKGLIQNDELEGSSPYLKIGSDQHKFGLYNIRRNENMYYVTSGGNHIFHSNGNSNTSQFGDNQVLILSKPASTFNCNVVINGSITYRTAKKEAFNNNIEQFGDEINIDSGTIKIDDTLTRSAFSIYGAVNKSNDPKSRKVDIYGSTILSTTDITSAAYYDTGSGRLKDSAVIISGPQNICNGGKSGNHRCTLFVTSQDYTDQIVYGQTNNSDRGASIGLGGLQSYFSTSNTVFARLSGVQHNNGTNGAIGIAGNFVVEVLDESTGNLLEAMRINPYGYVGIGTVKPIERLHVNGSLKVEGIIYNGSPDFILCNDPNVRGNSGYSRALVKELGKLTINYANDFGSVQISSNLTVTGNISATNLSGNIIWSLSDSRIKKNIIKSNTNEILNKINTLSLVNYDYIDNNIHDQTVYGLIAQEAKEIIPEFISIHSGCIPSIHSIATITYDDNFVTMNVNIPSGVILKEGHMINIKVNRIPMQVKIISKTSNSITVEKWEKFDEKKNVFVCGPIVDDLHSIDKPSIALMCIGGVQELTKRVVALEKNNNDLIAALQNALERISILEKNIPRY